MNPKPLLLLILDGWGHREDVEYNAILSARTPVLDTLKKENPNTLISTSGTDVGLPDGQMGNSEVGHMTLGAGRTVYQDFSRINNSISSGDFDKNSMLNKAISQTQALNSSLHIFGLLSPGGVHSHEEQIFAMIKMASAKGIKNINLHAFLDGRDTPPKSAETSIKAAETLFATLGHGSIASISGRFYSMDRDNRWDRVQLSYDMLTNGKAAFTYNTASEALTKAYARDESDEFVQPTLVSKTANPMIVQDDDAVIFMNFRADRARELTRAFVETDFSGFDRHKKPKLSNFITLTQYSEDIKTPCAFSPQQLVNTLGEHLQSLKKTQLRIAETEKYAHVTFFFSGGQEQAYIGETRTLIPSPNVRTYDMKPEMSVHEVTEKLIHAIETQSTDVIICNFANGDMVGHTGNFEATKKASEAVDHSIGKIIKALNKVDGECLITADHGNAEKMMDFETDQPHTAHTCGPVPMIYVGRKAKISHENGTLADIAPTLLHLLGVNIPKEMTGRSLIDLL